MNIFDLLLATHIFGGGLSLLLGMIILFLKKGNRPHVLLGNIYFSAMLIAALVAIPMCYLHPNYFLFVISIFTSYMLLTGRRSLGKTTLDKVNPIDWALTGTMLIFGFAFITLGISATISVNYFGVVLVVFGGISLVFVYQDYINFTGKSKFKNFWLTAHIQRMIGSYVASITAFLVVNNTVLPTVLVWLLPTVLLVPLIIKWTRKFGSLKSSKSFAD